MTLPILTVKNIKKFFGGSAAVNDVSFNLQPNTVLGLMGPNGAGKSTLMNIISGVLRPDSGSIGFQGSEITGLPPHKICRLGMARTFQIPQPFINMTVQENLMVALEYGRNLGKGEARGVALDILDLVGLTDKKGMYTRDLSAIPLKRLELARALASNPKLLLLDEVAAGLTEEEVPQMLEILQQIRERGITCILIEHVMRIMTRAVDKIIVLDEGAKIAEGATQEVMVDAKVIEAYLGESVQDGAT